LKKEKTQKTFGGKAEKKSNFPGVFPPPMSIKISKTGKTYVSTQLRKEKRKKVTLLTRVSPGNKKRVSKWGGGNPVTAALRTRLIEGHQEMWCTVEYKEKRGTQIPKKF